MIPAFPRVASDHPSAALLGDLPESLENARAWAAEAGIALAPVVERGPGGAVLALDATGAAVLVAGMATLTASALTSALGEAAAARQVGLAEVGSAYHRGVDRLREQWWLLRAAGTAVPTPAPPLIVLAEAVDADVEAALPLLEAVVRVHRIPVGMLLQAPVPLEAPAPAHDEGDPAEHEHLQTVVALVGEASLVLTDDSETIPGQLRSDGSLLVDGARFVDPAAAAAAALGRPVADGWAAWRFGADGPTLGEALQEARNQPPEPPKRTERPHRRRAVRP